MDFRLQEAAYHLSAIYSVFISAALGLVLVTQFEMASGLHQLASGGKRSMPIPRVIAIVAFVIYMILVLANLGCYEAYIHIDYSNYDSGYSHLIRAIAVLSFVIALLLVLSSVAVLVYTCIAPSALGTHRVSSSLSEPTYSHVLTSVLPLGASPPHRRRCDLSHPKSLRSDHIWHFRPGSNHPNIRRIPVLATCPFRSTHPVHGRHRAGNRVCSRND